MALEDYYLKGKLHALNYATSISKEDAEKLVKEYDRRFPAAREALKLQKERKKK